MVRTAAITGRVANHAKAHVAAPLDGIGGLLRASEFAATPTGCGQLIGWLQGFGTVGLIGIEGQMLPGLARAGLSATEGLMLRRLPTLLDSSMGTQLTGLYYGTHRERQPTAMAERDTVPEINLRQRLADRFREVNGDHPMTPADDAYATAQFTVLDELCAAPGRNADEARRLMLAQRLPLPSYLRSDGAEMVPADLFALAEHAGGIDRLQAWFTAHWADRAVAEQEWDSYLSGQYVCLRSVTPANIQRKDYLTAAISAAPNEPDAGSAQWSARLHALIDELDALEPAFTPYDRLRFGSPTSRDTCIDAMRARFPRHEASDLQRR